MEMAHFYDSSAVSSDYNGDRGKQSTLRSDFMGQTDLPDFSQLSDHPIEQADWIDINQKLRQSGYDPVVLSHPNKLNATSSGFIILDEMVAHSLRNTIESLLVDCARKQDLMQELVTSSNSLQRELDKERNKNEHCSKEITSVRSLLDSERMKFQEMERQRANELKSHSEQVSKLTVANSKLHAQNRELEMKNADMLSHLKGTGACQWPNDEKSRNRDSGTESSSEEMTQKEREKGRSKKSKKTSEIFQEYDKRLTGMQQELKNLRSQVSQKKLTVPNHKRSTEKRAKTIYVDDSKLIDITEDSEVTDYDLNDQDGPSQTDSESTTFSETASIASTMSSGISDAGFLYKRLKLTERKFKEAKKLIKELSEENAKLLTEVKKRPKLKEWRKTIVINKQMQNLLRENNLSHGTGRSFSAVENNIKKCTHVDNIDFLPIDVCRDHLKEVCSRMDVTNINDISRKLNTLEDAFLLNYKMEKVLRHLLRAVRSHEVRDDASECSASLAGDDELAESQWKCLVPTIKVWRDELKELKVLSDLINGLSDMLLPWKLKDHQKAKPLDDTAVKITVEHLKNQLKTVAEDCRKGPIKHRRGVPSRDELIHVVEHFMKLFDVEDITGTFARMNDFYVKNSEMANVLHTVANLLGLEKNVSATNIVNSVGTLAKAKHLLHVDDLETVITRLDQYDEFYLAFKSIISGLIEVLGVDDVDEIVPTVRALVRFP